MFVPFLAEEQELAALLVRAELKSLPAGNQGRISLPLLHSSSNEVGDVNTFENAIAIDVLCSIEVRDFILHQ
jgi:hypothetical protein